MDQVTKAALKFFTAFAMIYQNSSTINGYTEGECSGAYCALELAATGFTILGMLTTGVAYNPDDAEQ